jgi:hypothetical protein
MFLFGVYKPGPAAQKKKAAVVTRPSEFLTYRQNSDSRPVNRSEGNGKRGFVGGG